ncbi:hypothetical protein FOCG_06333 [Fusarium oxysporum f. sp. radicis-lycopersici 26381]|nr:hypothetical protein FOCG_06333 [Fusarium oxysporum f. sp. radicis-lycopersici 26381]
MKHSTLGMLLALITGAVSKPPLLERPPKVNVKNGTYIGTPSNSYNQDCFLGIPYAQPPVKNLSFNTSQSLNTPWTGKKPMNSYSAACIGYGVCESFNNVFGRTLNPYKLCLSPGGSGAGEAAQLSLRGSIMGVKPDIAGSVRVPARFTGVYGFRPEVNRLPWSKQAELASKGWQVVQPTLSPMARTAQDLTLFMKIIIQVEPWRYDSTAFAVPWHDAPRKDKLTIGV